MTQIDTIRHKYTQIDTYSHTIPHNMTHSWVGHKKSHIYIYIYIYIQSFHSFIDSIINGSHIEPHSHNQHSFKKKFFNQKTKQKKKSFNHSKKFKSFIQIKKNSQKPIEITIYRKINEIHQIPGVPKNTIFTDFQAF